MACCEMESDKVQIKIIKKYFTTLHLRMFRIEKRNLRFCSSLHS